MATYAKGLARRASLTEGPARAAMSYKAKVASVTPPTRNRVSSEGSFFFPSRINFKLVHSYNVKHLTCIIFCSSGLQNIYTRSIYGSVQHLQYLHWFTKFHIQNRPKGLPVGTY